jgi:hypothetical protein
MSPADFNALCEGYENKKHAEHELMRQQTFVLVSPYMDKGSGYERFKARWRFGWENVSVPELQPLTEQEIEAIKERHSKFIKR